MEQKIMKLEDKIQVYCISPYHLTGRKECFVVDWGSYWEENLIIEIGVIVTRKKAGYWKIVELELPANISDNDIQDITSVYWHVVNKQNFNKKCPNIFEVWEFNEPEKIWIATCEFPNSHKQISFAKQLKEMEKEQEADIVWEGENFFDILRESSPGICTMAAGCDVLEFDVLEDGRFMERSFCPNCATSLELTKKEVVYQIADFAKQNKIIGVSVRTFRNETVCIKNDNSEIVRVPIKEIRGFLIELVAEKENQIFLKCEKLSPDAVRESYFYDAFTGEYVRLSVFVIH